MGISGTIHSPLKYTKLLNLQKDCFILLIEPTQVFLIQYPINSYTKTAVQVNISQKSGIILVAPVDEMRGVNIRSLNNFNDFYMFYIYFITKIIKLKTIKNET